MKWFAQNGEDNVDQPLTRDLVHVTVLWQIVVDPLVLSGYFKDAFDAQGLVLRQIEYFDFFVLNDWKENNLIPFCRLLTFALASNEILEKVDCAGVTVHQICSGINCQEGVTYNSETRFHI